MQHNVIPPCNQSKPVANDVNHMQCNITLSLHVIKANLWPMMFADIKTLMQNPTFCSCLVTQIHCIGGANGGCCMQHQCRIQCCAVISLVWNPIQWCADISQHKSKPTETSWCCRACKKQNSSKRWKSSAADKWLC